MATQTLTGNLVRDWRHCENNALKAKFLGSAIAIPVSKRNDEGKLVQSDPDFKDIIVAGPAMKVVAQENILKRTNKNGEPERYLSVSTSSWFTSVKETKAPRKRRTFDHL